MAWHVRVGDTWRNTDDLTFDELEAIEKASGTGWSYISPHRDTAAARAILAAFMVRDGLSDADAQAAISALTARTLKHTFQHFEDDDLPDDWEDGLPVVDPKGEAASTGSS